MNPHSSASSRSSSRIATRCALLLLGAVALLAACTPPPVVCPSGIELLNTDVDAGAGWRYDYYVNHDQPCSESGEQTFMVGTRLTDDASQPAPLWAYLHGGGVGYYQDGAPMPNAVNKTQEPANRLKSHLKGGLADRVKESPAGFRMLAVSMCSHDTYAGFNSPDPGNDTPYEGQVGVPTTGGSSALAAIHFVEQRYATDDVVLAGGSAGSAGAMNVGYWMEQHGEKPTAIVADSGVVNAHFAATQSAIGPTLPDGTNNECYRSDEALAAIPARWDPAFQTLDAQHHLRLTSGQLTVPLMHVWNTNDSNQCGARLVDCQLPDGTTQVMGSTQCENRPIHDAIVALPASRHSVDFEVCVDKPGLNYPEDCDWHVPTQTNDVPNTRAAAGSPERDHNGFVMAWVEERVQATP